MPLVTGLPMRTIEETRAVSAVTTTTVEGNPCWTYVVSYGDIRVPALTVFRFTKDECVMPDALLFSRASFSGRSFTFLTWAKSSRP